MSPSYLPREMEDPLRQAARHFPVVALTGPRQSGKSTLLHHVFPKAHRITLDDLSLRRAANEDPALFLETLRSPALIDEIQYAPPLLPAIKMRVDQNRREGGQFFLSGSQIFSLMEGLSETLAGRVALFELLPLSWNELKGLAIPTFNETFKNMWRGFYPDPALHGTPPPLYYASYLSTYLERDIRQIRQVADLSRFQTFLELLAQRVSSLLNLQEIARDAGVSLSTARQWLSLLETTRIVFLLRPYFRNLRRRVVKHPKLYFTDTGLLAHLLKYPTPTLMSAGPMAGAFFENMVITEILKRKLNRQRTYDMYFLRDARGNEVDLLLDFGHRMLMAEIKLNKTPRPDHAKNIETFQSELPGTPGVVLNLADNEIAWSKSIRAVHWNMFLRTL
jgi:predicted AAA+ superfamily ATPase